MDRKHYYADVPGIGNIAVSRHAQTRMDTDGISIEEFEWALLRPALEVPDGMGIIFRDRAGVRVVIILQPEPFRGAKLVKTVFRLQQQEQVRP